MVNRVKHGGRFFIALKLDTKNKEESIYLSTHISSINHNKPLTSINISYFRITLTLSTSILSCKAKINMSKAKISVSNLEEKMSNLEEKIDRILGQLDSLGKTTTRRLEVIELKLSAIVALENNVAVMQKNVDGVVESQTFINEKYEAQEKIINNLINKNTALQKEMTSLSKNNKDKSMSIKQLNTNLNDLEQYGRREMVTVKGIPKLENENTDNLIVNLSKLIHVDLKIPDIAISHRTSVDKDAGIIVKFVSRRKRDEFFKNRKVLRDVDTSHLGFRQNSKIFINESLTQKNGDLLKKTRDLQKIRSLKFVWTKDGKIFARATEKSTTTNIKSVQDIEQFSSTLEYLVHPNSASA